MRTFTDSLQSVLILQLQNFRSAQGFGSSDNTELQQWSLEVTIQMKEGSPIYQFIVSVKGHIVVKNHRSLHGITRSQVNTIQVTYLIIPQFFIWFSGLNANNFLGLGKNIADVLGQGCQTQAQTWPSGWLRQTREVKIVVSFISSLYYIGVHMY